MLSPYQEAFIEFLMQSKTLQFGEFTLKSGRKAPYFINSGTFDDGERIDKVGRFYAEHIEQSNLRSANVIFGPAYKGIPLAVATSMALFLSFQRKVAFSFNRKEAKDHAEAGKLVGRQIVSGDRILLVEDVITAGTTLREVIPTLRALGDVTIDGVVVAVDRCEKGTGEKSAAAQASDELGVTVYPLVTIHQIVAYLERRKETIPDATKIIGKIHDYLGVYGA